MSTDTTREAVERLAADFVYASFATDNPLLRAEYQRTAATLRALLAEREGLDALIVRMQAQDVAAIQQWQAAHPGNDLVWPDQIRLTAWCMGEVARWRDECERLRLGGCARGQTTTQWCAEAVQMLAERDAARATAERMRSDLTPLWNRLRPNSTDTAEDMRRDMMHARAIVERMLAAAQDPTR